MSITPETKKEIITKQTVVVRIFARQMARELSVYEIDQISGGYYCNPKSHHTKSDGTGSPDDSC